MRLRANARLVLLALAATGGASSAIAGAAPAHAGSEAAGLASWYGDELAGNRTASGDRFDPTTITAAHRTLPLGSYAQVTDVESGRSIIVRINDRGPGRRDRVIDLSRGAAQQLGFGRRSVSRVTVKAYAPITLEIAAIKAGTMIGTKPDSVVRAGSTDLAATRTVARLDPKRRYAVQIATLSNRERATWLAQRLSAHVLTVGPLYRVRLGPLSAAEVQRARDAVAARGYGDAQILPAD
jgi:rare lipoprotein A